MAAPPPGMPYYEAPPSQMFAPGPMLAASPMYGQMGTTVPVVPMSSGGLLAPGPPPGAVPAPSPRLGAYY